MARVVEMAPVLSGWINVSRGMIACSNGEVIERHVEDHGDGVAVLPYDPDRRVALLISQPRLPVLLADEPAVLEVIAGRLDGLAPERRIVAEALEEGGVALSRLEPVVHVWSMPSISTERLHLFLAPFRASDVVGEGGGAEGEQEHIAVHEHALDALAALAGRGAIQDAKTLILIQALQLRHPHLFAGRGTPDR